MKLYWLDLETTGLDPSKPIRPGLANHAILEIAIAEAELETPFGVSLSVIPVSSWQIPLPLGVSSEDLDPFILDMHTKNGLLADCARSTTTLRRVYDHLLEIVPEVEDPAERPTLAGSSVHFDHGFLKVHMPELAKRFSHRYYDVSAVKLFCRSLGMERVPKAEAHRAADDIRESIDHAIHCANWLRYSWKPGL